MCEVCIALLTRSRNNSATQGGRAAAGRGPRPGKGKAGRKGGGAKAGRNQEDEEWRTVYIGFVERGTSEAELAAHFQVSSRRNGGVRLACL